MNFTFRQCLSHKHKYQLNDDFSASNILIAACLTAPFLRPPCCCTCPAICSFSDGRVHLHLADNNGDPQGYFVFHPFGGGTEIGFGVLLLEHRLGTYTSCLNCLSQLLSHPTWYLPHTHTHTTLEHADCSFLGISFGGFSCLVATLMILSG